MATERRRQVTYIDNENINRLDTLKRLGLLSKFMNWTLQKNTDTFLVEHIWKEEKP